MGYRRLKIASHFFLFLTLCISVSVLGGTGKNSKTNKLFRIPVKILSTEDLPEVLRHGEQKTEYFIQLFPETIAEEKNKPNESGLHEIALIEEPFPEEMTEIEINELLDVMFKHQIKAQFQIISGSFRIKANAEKLSNNLNKIGYEGTYVQFFTNKNLYRVIVQQHDKELVARQHLQQYRKENPNQEEAWLYLSTISQEQAFSETSFIYEN